MKNLLFLFCAILSIMILSCRDAIIFDDANQRTSGKITINLDNTPDEVVRVVVNVTRPNYQPQLAELLIDSTNQSASGTITGLVPGIWHIKVDAFDARNVLRYSGETVVEVFAGETSFVDLLLEPASGTIEIKVSWGTNTLQRGLILYFPFNGNINDLSPFNNHGQARNQKFTTSPKGNPNSAYLFNGIDNFITVPNSPSLNPPKQITITFWLRLDSIQSNYTDIFAKAGPAYGYFHNRQYFLEGKQNINLWYPQFKSAGDNQGQQELDSDHKSFNTKRWVYFTFIVDRIGHKMKYYVNGVLEKEIYDSYSTFNINSYPLIIGYSLESYYEHTPLKGAIDEFRIYNRVLSDREIMQLYNQ